MEEEFNKNKMLSATKIPEKEWFFAGSHSKELRI